MRYLTIMPDYTGSCIRDDFAGEVDLLGLGLPSEYVEKVNSWHITYREIIPLDEAERAALSEKIKDLDYKGIELAKKLMELIGGDAKVRYFSEGLLTFIPIL